MADNESPVPEPQDEMEEQTVQEPACDQNQDTQAEETSVEQPQDKQSHSTEAASGATQNEATGVSTGIANSGDEVKSKEEDSSLIVTCKFDSSWSTLSKEDIVDKVKGVIYGQAIGDALGLSTEFMTKEMAKGVYGKKGPSGYEVIYQDFHRSRWDKGDWTDDTDQMLLILQMIVDRDGGVDKLDFAKRIQDWMRHGNPEHGDIGGMGIGMTVSRTLSHGRFLTDPQGAAQEVWERSGKYLAANGAIMRTAILGVLNFNDLEKVVRNTVEIAKVTHADPRCAASCIAVNVAIALMLQGKYNPHKKDQLSKLVKASIEEAEKILEQNEQKIEMKEHINASSLDKLQLYDQHKMGYTYKALGAGFFALRNSKNFREMILKVIMEAGDADSNGAVCGALMGCKYGFRELPEDLLAFKHRQWLDQQVDRFLTTIGLI